MLEDWDKLKKSWAEPLLCYLFPVCCSTAQMVLQYSPGVINTAMNLLDFFLNDCVNKVSEQKILKDIIANCVQETKFCLQSG